MQWVPGVAVEAPEITTGMVADRKVGLRTPAGSGPWLLVKGRFLFRPQFLTVSPSRTTVESRAFACTPEQTRQNMSSVGFILVAE